MTDEDLTGEPVVLKRNPHTGKGKVLRRNKADPMSWLVEFGDGQRRWVHRFDMMVECDRS